MKKPIIAIFIALAAAASVFYAHNRGYFSAANPAPEFKAYEVKAGQLRLEVIARGVVTPEAEVVVKSKAAGEIVEFPHKEGERLNKGEVAVRLDPKTERTRANQAEANLALSEARLEKAGVMLKDAETRLKRQKGLFEQGMISRQDIEDAGLQHDKARSDLKIAGAEVRQAAEALKETLERLADTEITAPISGIILKKYVDAGAVISSTLSSVSEGTALFTMADLDKIYVNALVDEVDIGKLAAGQQAEASLDSVPGRVFAGVIERVLPKGRVERTVTVFEVYIRIDDKDKAPLKPGMTTDVKIIAGVKNDVLLVPNEALQERENKTGVFVMEAGVFQWREIKTGDTDGVNTEAAGGLKAGEIVGLPVKKPRENKKTKKGFFF